MLESGTLSCYIRTSDQINTSFTSDINYPMLNHLWHANKNRAFQIIQMKDMSLWNLSFTRNDLSDARFSSPTVSTDSWIQFGDQHQKIIEFIVCLLGFCIVVDFNVYLTKYTNLLVLYQHTLHFNTAICLLISSNSFEISFRWRANVCAKLLLLTMIVLSLDDWK